MKIFFSSKLFKQFLVWRVWLFISIFIVIGFLPFREGSLFTIFTGHIKEYVAVEDSVVFPWGNFDGIHYLSIASRGYVEEGRFLPIFPILIRSLIAPLTFISGLDPSGKIVFWSGLFLSNSFFVLALFYLKKLLRLDFSEKFSNKIALLLLVFPTSFFFISIYTESLFLLLSILVLYFSRKKMWSKAIFFSMLLSITRLPGVLILVPLVYEYLVYELKINFKDWKKFVAKFLSLEVLLKLVKFLVVPVPLIIYSVFNYYKWSDPLFFVNAHASLGNSREVSSMVFPLVTIYRYFKILITVPVRQYEFWVALLEFSALIFAVFGIIFTYLKKVRASYLLFAIALILLPIFSGTLTGFPRYLLLAFPVFIGFAAKFEKLKFVWPAIIFFSIVLQFVLLALFSRGWFVA